MSLRMVSVLLALAAASPIAAKEGAAAPPDLEARFRAFEQAFGAQDADKAGAMFAPDGTIINPAGERAEGRDQVTALFRKDFEGVLKGVKNKLSILSVRMVTPELAFVDIQQELTGGKPMPGRPTPWVAHAAVLLTKQGGGDWMVLDARPYFFLPRAPHGMKAGKAPAPAPAGRHRPKTLLSINASKKKG